MNFSAQIERFALAGEFRISRGARTEAVVVTATLSDGQVSGRGECVPYARYDETPQSVVAQLEAVSDPFDHDGLARALPPGAARNALDCALWDLAAKQAGKRVWEVIGMPAPRPEITAFTLSMDDPDKMEVAARAQSHRPLLKTKLGGEGDVARIEAVRRGAPDAAIIVDANEGWDAGTYAELAPVLVDLGVKMVEQPLPAGADDALSQMERPLPVCADEACHDRASLAGLCGKYDMINIKLDKTGGLTEALALREAGAAAGYQVMTGCMVGTSLGMAPAVLAAQGATFTDLDGPLLLAEDRAQALRYDAEGVHPSQAALWG